MQPISTERRVQRPSNLTEALACWLEATRRRACLRSLALADRSGMLLAGAGPSHECDEIAAWAPLLLNGQALTPPAPFALSGVKLSEMDVYVCAPGAVANAGALAEAAAGCERILNAQLT